jgi:DNA polymerase (family 10)
MTPLNASAVSRLLREFGRRVALRPGNPYRAKAYSRAADNLLALSVPLEEIIRQNRLREIPGIGEAIADIITQLYLTGTHPTLEAMRKEAPESLLELLTIPGLRPDKVLKLHAELGINSLAELEDAARAGRLQKIKGLGGALQSKILKGIEIRRNAEGLRHLHRAAELLEAAERHLRKAKAGITRVTPAGDFRRGCELVGMLTLVAQVKILKEGHHIINASDQLTVHLTDARHYGATLLQATGSDGHLEELRALATERGMALEESGLRSGRGIVAAATEEGIYAALGLPLIPPELREGRGEVARALAAKLPVLVKDKDIRGILHAHTDRSDGVDTLQAMAEATRTRGYAYFAWPIIPNRPITPAGSASTKSRSSTRRSTISISITRGAFTC